MPERAGLSLDSMIRGVMRHRIGDTGRFDTFTIVEVDYDNKVTTVEGLDGVETAAFWPHLFPAPGQVWMAHRRPGGDYVLTGMISPI